MWYARHMYECLLVTDDSIFFSNICHSLKGSAISVALYLLAILALASQYMLEPCGPTPGPSAADELKATTNKLSPNFVYSCCMLSLDLPCRAQLQ